MSNAGWRIPQKGYRIMVCQEKKMGANEFTRYDDQHRVIYMCIHVSAAHTNSQASLHEQGKDFPSGLSRHELTNSTISRSDEKYL